MDKLKQRFLFISVIVLVLLGLWLIGLIRNTNKAYSYIGQSSDRQATVMVNGEGKVVIKPDVAIMNFGLVSQNIALATAQKENTERMNNFLKGLKKDFSVDEKDVQTSNYSISPRYDWNNGQQKLIGYEVSQSVTVKVRNLEKLGDIIARAGAEQLNQTGNLQFTIDDPESAKKEARTKAFAQVKQRAEDLAKVSGVKLGRIISIQENNGSIVMPRPEMYVSGAMMKDSAAVVPSIQTGSNEITANVSIEYEIL